MYFVLLQINHYTHYIESRSQPESVKRGGPKGVKNIITNYNYRQMTDFFIQKHFRKDKQKKIRLFTTEVLIDMSFSFQLIAARFSDFMTKKRNSGEKKKNCPCKIISNESLVMASQWIAM